MEFEGMNLNEATLEELKEMELGHVTVRLTGLGMTNRLCSLDGKEVIAEYEFEGNFDEVVEQLKIYKEAVVELGFDEITAQCLITRKEKLLAFRANMDSDVKLEMDKYNTVLEAVRTEEKDPIKKRDHIIATAIAENQKGEAQNVKVRQDALHDAGVCECFTN